MSVKYSTGFYDGMCFERAKYERRLDALKLAIESHGEAAGGFTARADHFLAWLQGDAENAKEAR